MSTVRGFVSLIRTWAYGRNFGSRPIPYLTEDGLDQNRSSRAARPAIGSRCLENHDLRSRGGQPILRRACRPPTKGAREQSLEAALGGD
jgi:hypothetical protein